MWLDKCQVLWFNHIPCSIGYSLADTVCSLLSCCKDGLLFSLLSSWIHKSFSAKICSCQSILSQYRCLRLLFPRTDFAFIFVKCHAIPVILIFQLLEVSLHGSSFFQCIYLSSLFVLSTNLVRVFSIPFSKLSIKILNSIRSRTEPWGTPLVKRCQSGLELLTTHLSRSTSQPVLHL